MEDYRFKNAGEFRGRDENFHCKPDDVGRKLIESAIQDIINEISKDSIDWGKIAKDKRIREQLDLDSMDFLDIVMELRKRYSIEVPEKDYMRLSTLDGCVEYLMPYVKKIGDAGQTINSYPEK
jgi:acyl carrier protein